jgi:4-oxalocrotonate tautomerase
MPHVIVKLYSGKSPEEKKRLAEEVAKAVMTTLDYAADLVSVGVEDVAPQDWAEEVYKPDILGKPETIYKKPGYNPL